MSILGAQAVTLSRYPVSSRGSDGRWTAGTPTTSTIQATVQPMNGRDLMTLPEGERSNRWIKAYTETQLIVGSKDSRRLSDRLTYQGEIFEVRHVEQQPAIIPHYKVRASKLDEVTS